MLLAAEDALDGRARHPLREVDGYRRPRREPLRETKVGITEARVELAPIQGHDHTDGLIPDEQRSP